MSKISVLMSVYKKENPEYLRASLESILVQTRTADEILLIEDGPLTQELYQVVAEYQKKCDYLHVHAMEQNVQLGRALAKGVELCQYDLIARMDTDDIAMPDRLEKEGAYMEAHPEVDVVGGAIREFNDEGTIDRVKNMPKTQEAILEYVKVRNPLNHMTVMYRKDSILKAGNYKHFLCHILFPHIYAFIFCMSHIIPTYISSKRSASTRISNPCSASSFPKLRLAFPLSL
jgi:glycosyltransferase involved in cell wall biosynthesis